MAKKNSNMAKKNKLRQQIYKIMKIPLKILIKIRDCYMSSMIICDGQMGHGNYMGCPTPQVATVPRSFSVNSSRSSNSNEDLRELIRAASTRKLGNKIEMDIGQKKASRGLGGVDDVIMPRSFSVGIGRIDEEKPWEVGDDEDDVRLNTDLYPRSRSHAVSSNRFSVGA